MSTRPMLSAAETRAADQAAAWFARQRSGPLSDADATAFADWLKSDPLHTKSWAVYQQIWTRTDAVRDNPRVLAMRENARRRGERRKGLRGLWRSGLGLTAAMLFGVGVWWGVSSERSLTEEGSSAQKFVRSVSTEIGEHSLLLLPDGSKVTLNTASAIDTDYSRSERRVTLLKGEAFFEVAKDRARPFIVAAGTRQVIAVGTAFNVRLQEHRLRVTLVEGKVRVVSTSATAAQSASAVTLEPNSVLMTAQDGVDRIEHLDAVRDTSWREGKLIFDGERLAEVIAEMNRYSRQKLIIANAALEGRRVSGVFEPGGAPTFAKALEAYGIARASSQTPTAIVLDSL